MSLHSKHLRRLLWTTALVCIATPVVAQQGPRVAARSTGNQPQKHALDPAIQVAESALDSTRKLTDYSAEFSKREVVGRSVVVQQMTMKYRRKPFSVYLLFHGENDGREAIYVEGQNDNKLLVHETGLKSLIGTISLDPHGDRAMAENRHPITDIGIERLVEKLIDQWEQELKLDGVEVKYFPNAKMGDMECKVIETSYPKRQQGIRYHKTRLFIERSSNLPVRVEQYGFPSRQGARAPLVEQYTYSNLRTNRGFTNVDFSTRNPNYDF